MICRTYDNVGVCDGIGMTHAFFALSTLVNQVYLFTLTSKGALLIDQHDETLSGEVVVLSRFTVESGMEDAVRHAFLNRPNLVDDASGFIRMEVLQPDTAPQEFWLMTWWADQAAYAAWHKSHAYHASHKQMPKGLKLLPGSTSITRLVLVAR